MAMRSPIIVSTTFDVQGRRIREYKGVVRGISLDTCNPNGYDDGSIDRSTG